MARVTCSRTFLHYRNGTEVATDMVMVDIVVAMEAMVAMVVMVAMEGMVMVVVMEATEAMEATVVVAMAAIV